MKKTIKEMKKATGVETHLENIFVTENFKVVGDSLKDVQLGTPLKMITKEVGFFNCNNKQVLIEINDELLIQYFDKVNILMPNVRGFLLDDGKIAFNMEKVAEHKMKSTFDISQFVVVKKLPVYIIGSKIYFNPELRAVFMKNDGKEKDITDCFESIYPIENSKLCSSEGKALTTFRNIDGEIYLVVGF